MKYRQFMITNIRLTPLIIIIRYKYKTEHPMRRYCTKGNFSELIKHDFYQKRIRENLFHCT